MGYSSTVDQDRASRLPISNGLFDLIGLRDLEFRLARVRGLAEVQATGATVAAHAIHVDAVHT